VPGTVSERSPANPGPWLRILHFAPTRMALLYLALTYLYLSGFFFRTSFTHGPLQALAATVMAGAMMLIVYAGLVASIERRTVSELALPPMARELGLGLLLGFGLYSVCVLILMGLGNYRVVGLHDWASSRSCCSAAGCSASPRSGSAAGRRSSSLRWCSVSCT
jgi:uncharacterized protein